MTDTIVLYDYWRSSSAYRVRIALNLAGLPYRSIGVNLVDGAQRSEGHLALNPQGLVPALMIDGHLLTQSLAIIEYLDETRGLGVLPPGATDRARVRALTMAIAMEIQPPCNLRVARHAVRASGGAITQEGWMQHFIALGLAGVEALLTRDRPEGPYCHGAQITLADLCLVPQMYNARRWGVDLAAFPATVAVDAALSALAAFAAAHPDAVRPG